MTASNYVLRLVGALRAEVGAFSFTGATAGFACRTALASVLSILVAMLLHLDNPFWAGITAVSITLPNVSSSIARSIDRCLGTVIGAAVGYFGAHFVADHLIFQLIIGAAAAFGIYGTGRTAHGYAVLLGAVTVILVMFGSLEAPDSALQLAVYRSMEIMVGVAVAYLVELTLTPLAQSSPVAPMPGVFAAPIDESLLAMAITGGVATASIPKIWESLQLPGLDQTPITAFVILVAMHREPAWTALNRVIGCLLGGAYGLVCLRLVGDNTVLWLLLLFCGLYIFSHIKHGNAEISYSGHQAAVAAILSMVQGVSASPDILPAISRLVGMMGGIIVVIGAAALIEPLVATAVRPIIARWNAYQSSGISI
jgi:uncharacterized membrane protein YgaE (UPF0421/DUF939 family)